MFPCGSLSACLRKTFLVKEVHALVLLNIKRIEKEKGGQGGKHACFVFHDFKMFAHLCWPLSTMVLTAVTLLSPSLGQPPV